MRTNFVLLLRTPLKLIIKHLLYGRIGQLKTADLIKSILGITLVLFMIERYPDLNVIRRERPNVKVLDVSKLTKKQRRFADLISFIFTDRIYKLGSTFDEGLTFRNYVDFL
jgi:hypothetical protein